MDLSNCKITSSNPDSSRRRFVRNSLATTMSISFTGLIRAHGGSGGGQTTTWEPENTTMATTINTTWYPDETTWGTSYDTTWDPDGTTIDTTWETDLTTIPNTTIPETTIETTHDACRWVVSISIVFDRIYTHPNPDASDSSGRIFEGDMLVKTRNCDGREINIVYIAHCGGYVTSNSKLAKGSDTSIPAGNYTVAKTPKGWGQIDSGHYFNPQPPNRQGILVHGPERPLGGSSGCIAIQNATNGFADWQEIFARLRKCQGDPNAPSPIPIEISYSQELSHVYIWK